MYHALGNLLLRISFRRSIITESSQAITMPSSPDESTPCSSCAGAHDGGDLADASATISPGQNLQYQLSDPRRRQHTSPSPDTATGAWDFATAVAPPETATLEQDYWTTKLQAISQGTQGTSELYPGSDERPPKRPRCEFEADTPLPEAAPRTAPPTTCMDVFRADIDRAIQAHLGNPSFFELNCKGEGYHLRYRFPC